MYETFLSSSAANLFRTLRQLHNNLLVVFICHPCHQQVHFLKLWAGKPLVPRVSFCSNPSYGYNDIVTIPAGATNIDVKQRSHPGVQNDGNYLALKTADGQYLLNGNLAISAIEQDILVKGTILKYSGSIATLERLQSFRPLPEPLIVQLLTVPGELFPPKVKYTFFVPNDVNFRIQNSKEKATTNVIQPLLNAQWVLGDWSECSSSCGAGWQRRTVECQDSSGQTSTTCNKALKPEDAKPCGSQPCPL